MTVFLSLTLVMVLSLLLTLVEGVHYIGLNAQCRANAQTAAESAFGEYNRLLWDDYGILAMDLGYGSDTSDTAELERRLRENLDENSSDTLYSAEVSECAVEEYRLLTDDGGAELVSQAAQAEKAALGETLADRSADIFRDTADSLSEEKDIDAMLAEGQQAVNSAREAAQEGDERDAAGDMPDPGQPDSGASAQSAEQPEENPIDTVIRWRQKAVLEQVIPQEVKLSAASMSGYTPLSTRRLARGTMGESRHVSASDDVLFRMYLKDRLHRFGQNVPEKEEHCLSYEAEYIVCGKETEQANLEGMVVRLLALREAQNCAALVKDPGRMANLTAIATALAGASMNPAIVAAVKYGLVAAWAYVESVLDVRAMLAGQKVPIMKTPEQWTSDIAHLAACFDVHVMARSDPQGMDYESYLMILFLTTPREKLAMRAMDLMEYAIRRQEGYEEVSLDHMVCRMKCSVGYEASPLWPVPVMSDEGGIYRMKREEDIAYLKP